jgi:hypothetical protein
MKATIDIPDDPYRRVNESIAFLPNYRVSLA